MNYCPDCGVIGNGNFCSNCGYSFKNNEFNSPKETHELRLFYLQIKEIALNLAFTSNLKHNNFDIKQKLRSVKFSNISQEMEKRIILEIPEDVLNDAKKFYIDRYQKGEFMHFLSDIKDINVTNTDIYEDKIFYSLIKKLRFKIKIDTKHPLSLNSLSNEDVFNTIISCSFINDTYDSEETYRKLVTKRLLNMNQNDTFFSLVEDYVYKDDNDFRTWWNKEYKKHNNPKSIKNTIIETVETAIDFTSPRSAIKRTLNFFKD